MYCSLFAWALILELTEKENKKNKIKQGSSICYFAFAGILTL